MKEEIAGIGEEKTDVAVSSSSNIKKTSSKERRTAPSQRNPSDQLDVLFALVHILQTNDLSANNQPNEMRVAMKKNDMPIWHGRQTCLLLTWKNK
jgi:hypothetical protein